MCHELAHCLHSHHTDSFYKLVEQIKQKHAARLTGNDKVLEAYLQTEQSFGGFDIYQSTFSSQM